LVGGRANVVAKLGSREEDGVVWGEREGRVDGSERERGLFGVLDGRDGRAGVPEAEELGGLLAGGVEAEVVAGRADACAVEDGVGEGVLEGVFLERRA
jgi:hypothetical protein